MKKLLTILGLATLAITPAMTLVSCGEPKKSENNDNDDNNENNEEISSNLSDYIVKTNFSNEKLEILSSTGGDQVGTLAGMAMSGLTQLIIGEESNKQKLENGGLENTTVYDVLYRLAIQKTRPKPDSILQMIDQIIPFLENVPEDPHGPIVIENLEFDYKLLLSDFDNKAMDYLNPKDVKKYKEIFAEGSQVKIVFTNLTLNFPPEA